MFSSCRIFNFGVLDARSLFDAFRRRQESKSLRLGAKLRGMRKEGVKMFHERNGGQRFR